MKVFAWLKGLFGKLFGSPTPTAAPIPFAASHPTVPLPVAPPEPAPTEPPRRLGEPDRKPASSSPSPARPCATTCGSSCSRGYAYRDGGPDLATTLLVATVVTDPPAAPAETFAPSASASVPAEAVAAPATSYSPPAAVHSDPAPSYSSPTADYGGGGDYGSAAASSGSDY